MEKKRISIIIPTYNRAGTIERALDSIFNQTLVPDEIIVVDDGSTDETPCNIRAISRPYYHYI